MGTDIHSLGQVKTYANWWKTRLVRVANDDRNYDSFAILADVRNGSGFAGIVTGEGWPVIAPPRGLPPQSEFQKTTEHHFDNFWMGDHTHSWLLLSEMKEFLEKTLKPMRYKSIGVVSRDVFIDLKEGKLKSPESWCGAVGDGSTTIDESEWTPDSTALFVRTSWYSEGTTSAWYFTRVVEELEWLRQRYGVGDEDVRFIFGFDS